MKRLARSYRSDTIRRQPPGPGWPHGAGRSLRNTLTTFIEQVEADIARLKTRLEHIRDPRLRDMVTADIESLKARRADELRRLIAALQSHADLARRFTLVLSVPGIGERTALALVLRMPELGAVSREEAAALAGLAPFVRQSGRWTGEAHIAGGRSRLRRSLYAAALPAAFRWNAALKALYRRLIDRGKPHQVALVAPQTPRLRQHRRPTRHPVDRTADRGLMVATRAQYKSYRR
jgi:transposase